MTGENPETTLFSPAEKLARLQLIRTENVGPITFRHLISRFGSAEKALAAIPALAKKGGRRAPTKIPDSKALKAEVRAAKALGADYLFLGEAAYPPAMAALEDAPPVLCYTGHAHLLSKPCLGMVGARNASVAGLRLAAEMAEAATELDFVVVSGMARGIDAAAHQAALTGGTAGCLAGGIDIVYPRENANLQAAVAARGCLITEMPLGTRPQARHFPRRNRLIAGLSEAVLVIEAAAKSGSLITARLAAEAGREVLAIPGSPKDPRSEGANRLLKQGATLITGTRDLQDELRHLLARELRAPEQLGLPGVGGLSPAELAKQDDISERDRAQILTLLSPTPCPLDALIEASGMPTGHVLAAVLELELAGQAMRVPGGRIVRCYDAETEAS